MKVTLSKHGGLAAIRWPPIVVNSSVLPTSDAGELARLVRAVRDHPSIIEEQPGRGRDVTSYTITLEDEGGEPTTFRQSDMSMSQSFASLVEWMERHSGRK